MTDHYIVVTYNQASGMPDLDRLAAVNCTKYGVPNHSTRTSWVEVDMSTELVDLGRCPTCGTPRWRVPDCTCGHMIVAHDIGTRGGVNVRSGCTHHGCGCKRFEEAVSDGLA